MARAALRDTPCEQCTSTLPPSALAACTQRCRLLHGTRGTIDCLSDAWGQALVLLLGPPSLFFV